VKVSACNTPFPSIVVASGTAVSDSLADGPRAHDHTCLVSTPRPTLVTNAHTLEPARVAMTCIDSPCAVYVPQLALQSACACLHVQLLLLLLAVVVVIVIVEMVVLVIDWHTPHILQSQHCRYTMLIHNAASFNNKIQAQASATQRNCQPVEQTVQSHMRWTHKPSDTGFAHTPYP
jgi:hypothetical protein